MSDVTQPAAPTTVPGASFRSHVARVLARARQAPGRTILQEPDGSVTAAQFACLVRDTAADLRARGVTRGALVAIAAPTTIAGVVLRYAAGRLGCATLFCPTTVPDERLAAFLQIADADVLVGLPATARHVEAMVARGAVGAGMLLDPPVRELSECAPDDDPPDDGPPDDPPVAADDLAVLATTGGTTGSPKLSCRSFADWLAMVDLGPMPERRQLLCSSLAYIAQVHLDQTLLCGGTAVLLDGFDPARALATIEAERITHLGLVEPKLSELLEHPDAARRDLSSLRAVAHIGADAAPSLKRRWLQRLGPVLVHPYGASETSIISMLTPADYVASSPGRLRSVGRPMAGVELRLVDDPRAGPGEGRIQVRARAVATRFRTDRPYAPFDGEWFDTGDLGRLDGDGYLHVRGRASDALRIGSGTVLPVDVQEVLCARPDVCYAVAIPLGDPVSALGVAAIPARGQLDPEPLRRALAAELRVAETALRVIVLERIPVTEQGKPDRPVLGALLEASR